MPTPKPPRTYRALAAILIGFAILALVYSLVTPLKYGPDEPAHFIYIRSLATTFSPPPIARTQTHTEDSIASHEGHQPPLYYAVMAVPYAILNAFGPPADTIWRVLRILGIAIGVFWIYFVYRLAREYFASEAYALATAAFVALIPNAAYTAGVVNNDIMIALLFTWAMVPILRFFKTESLSNREAAALGALTGLAILTKAQALILVGVFAIAALAVCRRRHYANAGGVLRAAAIVLGVAVIVSGWWFVRCWIVYGTPMPHSLYNPVLPDGMISLLVNPALGLRAIWFGSAAVYTYFWTPFWLVWKYVTWSCYFWPLVAVNAAALVGVALRLRRGGVDGRSLALLVFAALLTYAMWLRYALAVDRMANLQGRLFLPVAAVVGIIFVLGTDGWLAGAKAKRIGVILWLVLMLAANAAVIACDAAFYASGGV
jgi:4-amino-4-deoxy-L-arabinose transferase-like glycosyltransferase